MKGIWPDGIWPGLPLLFSCFFAPPTPPQQPELVFPVVGECQWTDTFGAPRSGGARKHQGQDLMAPQMTPLVACFEGTVTLRRRHPSAGNWIILRGDNGWIAHYIHLNDDRPGTDDESGGDEFAFAPALKDGARVRAGELLGWAGNSGNARYAGCHLHFELLGPQGLVNPAPFLRAARRLETVVCPPLPLPTLPLPEGTVRVDAVLRAVDLNKGVLAVSPIALTEPGGRQSAVTVAARRWPVLRPDAYIGTAHSPWHPLPLQALGPGDRVIILARQTGPYKPLSAYRVLVAPAAPPLRSGHE